MASPLFQQNSMPSDVNDSLQLPRRRIAVLSDWLMLFAACVWMLSSWLRDAGWLLGIWAVVGVFFAVNLCITARKPELRYQSGYLYFMANKRLGRYVTLPVHEVAQVLVQEREVPGIWRMEPAHCYLFLLKDGRQLEYFPKVAKGEYADQIADFLRRVPALPNWQSLA